MNEASAAPPTGEGASDHVASDTTTDMAEVEAEIARTRADLARTVDELAAKLDLKTRLRHGVRDAKDAATVQLQSARERLTVDGRPRPEALGVGGGVLAAVAAVVLVRLWWRPARSPRRRPGRR
jgi:hypothetical protein